MKKQTHDKVKFIKLNSLRKARLILAPSLRNQSIMAWNSLSLDISIYTQEQRAE